MLLKDSVFVVWINNFKCAQFKDECEPGISQWTLIKLYYKWSHKSDVIVVTPHGHLSNTDTSLCPFGLRIREVRL